VSAEPTELKQAKSHDVTFGTQGRARWIEDFSSVIMNLKLFYFIDIKLTTSEIKPLYSGIQTSFSTRGTNYAVRLVYFAYGFSCYRKYNQFDISQRHTELLCV